MWGNAVRHMDAFRRDTGDLIRPMVQAMLDSIGQWANAVPPLQTPLAGRLAGYGRIAWLLAPILALGCLGFSMVRMRQRAMLKRKNKYGLQNLKRP